MAYINFVGIADNSTDNTSALNLAFSQGNEIFIPKGNDYYKFSGAVTIPAGKTLSFENGAKFNVVGKLTGNQTTIIAGNYEILKNTTLLYGTWITDVIKVEWFGPKADSVTDDYNSLDLVFQMINKCTYNKATFGVNKNYFTSKEISFRNYNDLILDGQGSKLIRSYNNLQVGVYSSIFFANAVTLYTKYSTTNLVEGEYTTTLTDVSGLVVGMGILMTSTELYNVEDMEVDSNPYPHKWHYHYKGLMSIITEINGNVITMADPIPYDFDAENFEVKFKFYNVYKIDIRNLKFSSIDADLSVVKQMGQLRLETTFDTIVDNIICDPIGYTGINVSRAYNARISNVQLLYKSGKSNNNYYCTYGIIPVLNVNCVYDNIYGRAWTHGFALSNEPSYNTYVKNSNFKAMNNESNGGDSHASHWVKFENTTFYGFQGNWGTFIFDNCELYNIQGQSLVMNMREGGSRGGLILWEVKNSNIHVAKTSAGFSNIIYRYDNAGVAGPDSQEPVNNSQLGTYIFRNNKFYIENKYTYLTTTTIIASESTGPEFIVEDNEFHCIGDGCLYMPRIKSGQPNRDDFTKFTFNNNKYDFVKWIEPPLHQFTDLEVIGNTPFDQSTGAWEVNWSNYQGLNILLKDNVFNGTNFKIVNCNGNIVLQNNTILNTNVNVPPDTGTSDPIVAEFSSDITTANENQPINFVDQSTGDPVSWLWNFNGGTPSTSIEQNPQGIVFNTWGTYSVTLTVTNSLGEQSVNFKENYINILEPQPVAEFSADDTFVGINETVNFTDLSSGDISLWNWTFNGGNPSVSTDQNPQVSFSNDGFYDITLKVTTNSGLENILTKGGYISVEPDPIANFVADITSINSTDQVNFTDQSVGSITSWNWVFEGGAPSTSSEQNPQGILFSEVGYHDVSLTVTNGNNRNDVEIKDNYIETIQPVDYTNPVAHWLFNEFSGTTAYDCSGNNYHGTLKDGTSWSNVGVELDGSNDKIDILSSKTGLNMNKGDFSLCCWVKMAENQPLAFPTFFGKGATSSTNPGYWFYYNTSQSNIRLVLGDGTKRISYPSSTNPMINDNKWHHLAVTVKRDVEVILYVDGIDIIKKTMVNHFKDFDIKNDNITLTIGSAASSSSTFLKGNIEESFVYKRVLSPSEILEMASVEKENHKMGEWKLDEGFGTLANDTSGNNLNGTIEGCLWNEDGTLQFDGINDSVKCGDVTNFNIGLNDMVISADIKLESEIEELDSIKVQPYSTIVAKGAFYNEVPGYWFYYRIFDKKLCLIMGDGVNRVLVTSDAVVLGENWHNVKVIINRQYSTAFYLDDVEIGNSNISLFNNVDIVNNERQLTIGAANDIGTENNSLSFFNGKIKNVVIFDKIL